MTHENFIAEVAKRLEWPEEKTTGIIEVILEVISAELKMNNPVVIDDFGTLKTDVQSEYILVNPKTKERHLMPPAVEIVFEAFFQESGENSSLPAGFVPDEALYNDVNTSFSQFEPTPLNKGVQFPGIPEIVAEEPGATDPPEIIELAEHAEQTESVDHQTTAETSVRTEPDERTERIDVAQSPPKHRSRRGLRSNKRTSPVWIPIAGGIAIVVASLFFFKGGRNK